VEKRWIWPFELLDKLGEGGMGVVYRARYVVDNRHVAVKLLPPDIANDTILSRFERELEILKTLRHPNIVRCFGGVCEGNQHFYAMELVEGGTLDRLLEERGKFTWEVATQFALQMASGLAYAHERGVVHRDVKPGNFLLTPAGKLKLSDFGLATVEAATKITAAGKTMGTFPYMAPEQIRGRPPVSAQTDLYAFGCVIFEMLAGRTPFSGETPAEVMHKHLDETPPRVAEFALDCPAALDALVQDLLRKEPGDRPDSAFVVAKHLTEISQGNGSAVRRTAEHVGPITPPRGLLEKPRSGTQPAPANRSRWLAPLLGGLLCLSLAWNIRSMDTVPAKRAEELWIEAYHSGRSDMRDEAARALGQLAPNSPQALDLLIAGLSDQSSAVRSSAIDGLTLTGAAGRSAIGDLLRLERNDENLFIRKKATEAIKSIRAAKAESFSIASFLFWLLLIAVAAGAVVAFVALRNEKKGAPESR
jgi:eukaryotic-like serine/threonine-protein kinase